MLIGVTTMIFSYVSAALQSWTNGTDEAVPEDAFFYKEIFLN